MLHLVVNYPDVALKLGLLIARQESLVFRCQVLTTSGGVVAAVVLPDPRAVFKHLAQLVSSVATGNLGGTEMLRVLNDVL